MATWWPWGILVLTGCGRFGFGGFEPVDAAVDTPPASGFCDPQTEPGLVACFRFDGDATDASGGGHDASATNTSYVPGRVGQALHLTTTSMVQIPETPALDVTKLTFEFWLRPEAFGPGDHNLLDNFPQYEVELTSAGLIRARYFIAGTNRLLVSASPVAVNVWTHVALTFDGARFRIYLDGIQDVSQAAAGALDVGGTMGTWIGRDHDGGEPLLGLLDDLRVFDHARPASEICGAAGAVGC